jgi:hypothetical protein
MEKREEDPKKVRIRMVTRIRAALIALAVMTTAAAALISSRQNDGASPATVSPVGLPAPGVWQLTLPPGSAAPG